MGAMSFILLEGLTDDLLQELERASVAAGPDNLSWPPHVSVEPGALTVRREVDESGSLVVPWSISGAGLLMGSTGTLIERSSPYRLVTELARGKVNQLRGQAADWVTGGLQVPADMADEIRTAGIRFGQAVTETPADQDTRAQAVLEQSYRISRRLVELYIEQMFQARHLRQPRLDTQLGCRLNAEAFPKKHGPVIEQTFNSLSLSFAWKEIEPAEASYRWEPFDALLHWAEDRYLTMSAGPLIDFTSSRLPDWLWLWQRDLSSIASFMCDYVETAVRRYQGRIRTWQLTASSNSGNVLGLGEDELLWLTARLIEAARQVDPKLELAVGISQPWGEYMVLEDRTHPPFIFADTLIRAGLNLAALDIELVMGVWPRGSYCRDLLEISRLLDLYSLLGVPLRVTLGYPSSSAPDPLADADLAVAAGHWRDGFAPEHQADWVASCTALALCKPTVRSVHWVHWSDGDPHYFPHCGLASDHVIVKPAVERLRALREAHLR
jgi:hypothetical protein